MRASAASPRELLRCYALLRTASHSAVWPVSHGEWFSTPDAQAKKLQGTTTKGTWTWDEAVCRVKQYPWQEDVSAGEQAFLA